MKLKELFDRPERWTKRATGRDHNGTVVGWNSNSAVSFCLVGAILKCYPSCNGAFQTAPVVKRLSEKLNRNLTAWNDEPERTFEDIKQLVNELDI